MPDEWGLATPVGTVPLPEGGWSWGHDPASQTEDVIRQLSAMEMAPPGGAGLEIDHGLIKISASSAT